MSEPVFQGLPIASAGYPGAIPAPSAPSGEWQAAVIPTGSSETPEGGAKPLGPPPTSPAPIDAAQVQSGVDENTHFAMAGEVVMGIPSALKISDPSTPHYRSGMCSALFWGSLVFILVAAVMDYAEGQQPCTTNDDDYVSASPSPNPSDDDHVHNNDNRNAYEDGTGTDYLERADQASSHASIRTSLRHNIDSCYPSGSDGPGMLSSTALPTFLVVFLVYLVESCCSDTRKYMSNFKDVDGCESYMQSMTDRAPDIVMRCVCWHYETRTRMVTYTDSNGNSRTRYETYTVKVVTYRETCYFEYEAWKDDSGSFHGLSLYSIVKLKLYKLLVWADDAARDSFYRAYAHFQMRNRWRDTHFEHSWCMELSGFKTNLLSMTDESAKPWWLSLQCFCVWSILGLSWCFRRALTNASVEAEFTFRKVIRS
jgi:hypothetical protein